MKIKLNPKPFHYSLGSFGETLAEDYLRSKSYRILYRNYRCALGEIDLVAKKGRRYHFIEVKTRQTHAAGLPEESVDLRKQKRLVRLVQWFLKEHQIEDKPVSLDVLAISALPGAPPEIRYFPDAFINEDANA